MKQKLELWAIFNSLSHAFVVAFIIQSKASDFIALPPFWGLIFYLIVGCFQEIVLCSVIPCQTGYWTAASAIAGGMSWWIWSKILAIPLFALLYQLQIPTPISVFAVLTGAFIGGNVGWIQTYFLASFDNWKWVTENIVGTSFGFYVGYLTLKLLLAQIYSSNQLIASSASCGVGAVWGGLFAAVTAFALRRLAR